MATNPEWDGNYNTPPSQSGPTLPDGTSGNVTPPAVPGNTSSGSGNTSVDTPSMDLFASNIGLLIGPAKDAATRAQNFPAVAPGQFYHAYQIQDKVTGPPGGSSGSGTTDLVTSYQGVFTDLADGLTNIQKAAQAISAKYKTTQDLNNLKVSELNTDFSDASTDFNNSVTANGGSSGSGNNSPSGSGSGSGNKPSGSNTKGSGSNTKGSGS
jgi:hypothetical protein